MKFIKNKIQAFLLILAILGTQNLMAQREGHHHPKMMEELKEDLNLSTEQTAQIEKLEVDFKTQIETLKADDSKERGEKRAAMRSLMENQKAAVEKILTAEQKVLLKERKVEHRAERKAKMKEHKKIREELEKELKTYRVEEVEPVIKAQRAKLETTLSDEDKIKIAALRVAFAAKKSARKEEMQKHKAARKAAGEDRKTKMDGRKGHRVERENDEDFKALKVLVEKYESDIDALHAEIEPEVKKWKEEQKAIVQKFKQEKGAEGRSRGQRSMSEEKDASHRKGKAGRKGKHGHHKGRAGKMKRGHFLLIDPNQAEETTTKQALTQISIFPNPAITTNNLNYTVKEAGRVKIEIHDAQGRLVSVLLDEERTIGDYQLEVNVSDLKNRVYYYVVFDKQGVTTKKIIITTK